MQTFHEEIKITAYELYKQRGMAQGYDLDDWLQAERIVTGKNIISEASLPVQRQTGKEKKTKNNKSKKKGDKK